MQALVWEGPRQMNLREVADPQPAAQEVLIKVIYSGICGSELGGYLGHNSLRKPPLIMGHEFAGEIVALGEEAAEVKPGLTIGQRVTVNPLISPPWSAAALKGRHNLTMPRNIVGIHRPGSYAQYVTAPATNVYPLPATLSLEHAALTEPMAWPSVPRNCPAAWRPTASDHRAGADRLVGLTSGQGVWRARNLCDRYGCGSALDWRTFWCAVLDPQADNVVETVRKATNGAGVDMAIDAVGATATRRECIEAVTPGGKVIFTGLHSEESNLQANYIIRNEINCKAALPTPRSILKTPLTGWSKAALRSIPGCSKRHWRKVAPCLKNC